ncbi:MAG: ABC transporter permease [Phycisphaerales bacterium]|nr:ABC transporter permease [Phycisphaerales bacterium]
MGSMQPVWHLAHLTLLGRPMRCVLVAAAIAVASALVVAMSCAIETAVDNVQARMEKLIGEADARVIHQHGANFDPAMLQDIQSWDSVAAAAGRIAGALLLERVDESGPTSGRSHRATVRFRGTDLAQDASFAQLDYRIGRAPNAPLEVGLDPSAAEALGASVGTRLMVVRFGEPLELIVSGLYTRPTLGALQRPSGHIARETLAQAADSDDGVAMISIALAKDVDATAWVAAHKDRIRSPLLLETTTMATSGLDRPARVGRLLLAILTMLAFLCCSIIVATAMTTALAQQQRELAITRCVGASRCQLVAGQVLAGAALGGAAGAVGVPIGLGLARGVVWWYSSLLPEGMTLAWQGVALAVAGAIIAGTLGALWPAVSAARVDVLKALSPHASPTSSRSIAVAAGICVAAVGAQVALLLVADHEARFWAYVLAGLPLLHLGLFLAAVPVLWVVGCLLSGALEKLLGLPRSLLKTSIVSSVWRMGLVAGALMIGVAILVGTWTSGRAILSDVTQRIRFGDAFAFKSTGFSSAESARIRAIEGIDQVAAVGYLPLRVVGTQVFGLTGIAPANVVCIGFEVDPFLAMNHLEWVAGDPTRAAARLKEGDAILVASEFMVAKGIGPGQHLELGSADDHKSFEVVGVVGAAGLDVATQFFGIRSFYMEHAISCVFMDFDAVARHFGSREAFLMQMSLPATATRDDERRIHSAIEAAAPGTVFASGRSIRNEVLDIGRVVMTICSSIAGGALILASLACATVIAAGVSARQREFGILQAVGATRGLVVRLVAGEAIVMGVTASLVGTAFGWHLAWMEARVYHDLVGLELHPTLDPTIALIGAATVIVTALLASVPSMRLVTRRSPSALLTSAAA